MESLTVPVQPEILEQLQAAAKERELSPDCVITEVIDCWVADRRQKAAAVSDPRSLMKSCSDPSYSGHVSRSHGHGAGG